MIESPDLNPVVSEDEGVVPGRSPRPIRSDSRSLERDIQNLIPVDLGPPSGTVDLRSGQWRWTLLDPMDGDALDGCILRLVDPSDPRRRMEVPGLPRTGVEASEVSYFARRAEARWVPCGPGEYHIRMIRLPLDLATPFGTRVGVRIRAQTPSGTWREGSLAPGVRIGDLTDAELQVLADRARPVPMAQTGDRGVADGMPLP